MAFPSSLNWPKLSHQQQLPLLQTHETIDLSQACDLEEVMMDALVNDKPDFVRLFVDNGVNLGEFLTYGRLQKLYWSVSEKSLLHNLLLKKYEEKQLLRGAARTSYPLGHHPPEQGDRKPRFTLFEVAKVLKDFLHDSCKGFYQKVPTVSAAGGCGVVVGGVQCAE